MDQIQFWIRDRVHVLTLQLVYQANKAIHPTRHGKIYLIFKSEQSKQKKALDFSRWKVTVSCWRIVLRLVNNLLCKNDTGEYLICKYYYFSIWELTVNAEEKKKKNESSLCGQLPNHKVFGRMNVSFLWFSKSSCCGGSVLLVVFPAFGRCVR